MKSAPPGFQGPGHRPCRRGAPECPGPRPATGRALPGPDAGFRADRGLVSGELALQWQAPAGDAAKAGATGITPLARLPGAGATGLQQGKTALASVGKLGAGRPEAEPGHAHRGHRAPGHHPAQGHGRTRRRWPLDGRALAQVRLAASPSSATTAQASAPDRCARCTSQARALKELAVDEGSVFLPTAPSPAPWH